MRLVPALLACFLMLMSGACAAQTENRLYQVSDVAVDLTVDATQLARDVALVEAQKKAFDILMERLVQKQPVKLPEEEALASMVSSFEIQKEHITNKRYIGSFSIQFASDKVQSFLDSQHLTYHEVKTGKLLVLPIFLEEGRAVLWEDVTPWRAAWAARLPTEGVLSLRLPEGDLQDIALVSSSEAVAQPDEKMSQLIKKYSADGALVVVYPMTALSGAPAVKVSRLDKSGSIRSTVWVNSVDSEKKEIPLAEIVSDTIKKAEEQYIEDSVAITKTSQGSGDSQPGKNFVLTAKVSAPTLAAWSSVQRKLTQISIVRSLKVLSMTRGLVVVDIESSQSLSDLQAGLTSAGLSLVNAEGGWEISPLDLSDAQ